MDLNNVSQNVLQIINKHKGAVVQVAYLNMEKGVLRTHKGILRNMNETTIQLSSESNSSGYLNIKFFQGGTKCIYAIYNKNFAELLSLRNIQTLNKVLRNPEDQKKIISKLKPLVGKDVSVIFKKMDTLQAVTGKFSDMGFADLIVKPAPFYNSESRLAYNSILNVFDQLGFDALDLPIRKKQKED